MITARRGTPEVTYTARRRPTMKNGIHPKLNPVVFVDGKNEFITRSTMTSTEKRDIDGVEHFVITVEISSATHPFFTGKQKLIDTAGRVERFNRKYNRPAAK